MLCSWFPIKQKNPEPIDMVTLGEMLFNEKKLSKNDKISCSSCHIPRFAFADTVPFSLGADGLPGKRNTPSITNMSSRPYFFYDGRAATLEEQVSFPIEDHLEMNILFHDAVKKIATDKNYITYFKTVFGEIPNEINIRRAIAAFENTLETGNTPFDRWMNGDSTAMSPSAIRGRILFMNDDKTKCFLCHFSPDFTGDQFRNIGLFDGKTLKDSGRFDFTRDRADLGKFKTPGLRNVSVTAPYMHNGMFKTLKEVLDYYNNPIKLAPFAINTDTLIQKPLGLNESELVDLENFLHALTDDRFIITKK